MAELGTYGQHHDYRRWEPIIPAHLAATCPDCGEAMPTELAGRRCPLCAWECTICHRNVPTLHYAGGGYRLDDNVCVDCADRANQRGVDCCVFCGRDTNHTSGLCRPCREEEEREDRYRFATDHSPKAWHP